MLGQTVSHYQILEKLGGGGMGIVYKARDLRLDRVVALKFLPPELTRDDEAKRRFTQEAHAASALDYPNICTIYDIEEASDGQMFLAMAFYGGETLKKKIERGPMKLDHVVDIAIQIAQGLAKAHAAGIVHRDIKPANVIVTSDDLVKIVDFGLAKLIGQAGLTRTGTMLGTVAYMSPEQVLAEDVDHRTDVWSLGVVIYEMIAGRLPFKGDTQVVVSNAILRDAPEPLSAVRTGVPKDLERVVERALSRRADERQQSMADFVSELRRLQRASGSEEVRAATEVAARAPARKPVRLQIVAIATVLVALGALGWIVAKPGKSARSVPRATNAVQVTSALGVEDFPTWSPDGTTLAYMGNPTGERGAASSDLWVSQIGAGSPVNRTTDNPGQDGFPAWSPDGRQVAFSSNRPDGGVLTMAGVGGTPRRIIPTAASGFLGSDITAIPTMPVWAPDSASLGYPFLDSKGTAFLHHVTLQTGETRRITLPGRLGNARMDITWSPNGRFLSYVDGRNYTAQVTQLWVLRLADGKAIPIGDGRMNEWGPSWSPDSRVLYFVSNREGSSDLWQQRLQDEGTPDGTAERITTGVEMRHAVVSRDGRKVAYSKGRNVANVWRVPILSDRAATWNDAQQLTFDQAFVEYGDVSSDGTRLILSSDRSGNPDLWIMPASGGDLQQFTTDPTPDWDPRWSPDGRQIAFYAYRSGNREIWVIPSGGGPARQLTKGEAESVYPTWSPDGQSIAFSSPRSGNHDIWIVSIDGGELRRVTDDPASDQVLAWSRDGKSIAFIRGGRIWRVSPSGGPAQPLSAVGATLPRWSSDGKHVYFRGTRDGVANIWEVSVDAGTERSMTELSRRRGILSANMLTTDGKYIYFAWQENFGDIWVMDLER